MRGGSSATGCKKAAEETQAFSYQPALKPSSPTKAPVVTTSRPSLLRTKADGSADDAAVSPNTANSGEDCRRDDDDRFVGALDPGLLPRIRAPLTQ